tara:strand:- start:4985 stop:6079 length:1095 start_codon:yes stop_codon:yes gene_type:complete
MKVLYIGNYKDGTGWANACINNILALDAVGVEVVPRAITFNNSAGSCPDRILELENNSEVGCDICIQHTLPHLYSYDSKFKNIGFIATETSNFIESSWQHHANLMDEIWVPTQSCKNACIQSEITQPVKIAPHSLDISKYNSVKYLNQGSKIDNLINTFNFVFVGEFVERKNIQALVKAFHMEFEPDEPVNLYIKTSQQSLDYVQNYFKQIKQGLKLRKEYKEEVVICGQLGKEDYMSTISQCHSFVMPSRGEGFCIPALEAMAMGIPVIYTEGTGMDDFCSGSAVKSSEIPCFGAMSTIDYLYTANEKWRKIDLEDLMVSMREVFMKWNTEIATEESREALKRASEFSHKEIGLKLKEILNDG